MRLSVAVALLASLFSTAGHAAFQPASRTPQSQAHEVRNGSTTARDITAWLGEPTETEMLVWKPTGCIERWRYEIGERMYLVDFDAQGKVCNHGYYEIR